MPPGGRKWHLVGRGACGKNKRLLLCEDFCNCRSLCLPWTFASVTSAIVSRLVSRFVSFYSLILSEAISPLVGDCLLYYIISSHPLWDLCHCPLQLSLWIFLFILQNPLWKLKFSVMLFKFDRCSLHFVLGNITHLSWLKAYIASLRFPLDLSTFG